MKDRILWVGFIVVTLSLSVAFHVAVLVVSMTDPSFAVEADYERKADEWDASRSREQASDRLGWTVELATRPSSTAGEVHVEVAAFDRVGAPVRDALVRIEAFHNARASNIARFTLPYVDEGRYEAVVPLRRSGVWEFRLSVARGDELYIDRLRKSVLSVPRERGSGP